MANKCWPLAGILFLVTVVMGCQSPSDDSLSVYADKVFMGGDIVTVDEANLLVEAAAVTDGKIQKLGSLQAIKALIGPKTNVIDLKGKTLVPGFVDGHSHFSLAVMMAKWVNISPPPVGPADSIDALISVLKNRLKEQPLEEGEWLLGYGYDENKFGRHIDRSDLDPHFPNNPVALMHISGHGAVLNGQALALMGIDSETQTPAGGVIARMKSSLDPAGLLMETAWLPVLEKLLKKERERLADNFQLTQQLYARNGYTTVQDGAMHYDDLKTYMQYADQGEFYLDLMVLPIFNDLEKVLGDEDIKPGQSINRVTMSGIKIVVDGSPQGKTAYFTESLHTHGPTGEKDWAGQPIMSYEHYLKIFTKANDAGWRVYTHGNGDAAIDMIIKAHREVGISAKDERRNVVIHSQFVRPDQLDSYVELGVSPSYFSNHAYYWGDVHIENLGEERAGFLSPMKTSSKKGLRYSNHTDYIVSPLNPMMTMWTATNRQTRSGTVLDADERITALQALKAITIDAAYQYFDEDIKGSIEVGKMADLVVLSDNPITVSVDRLREIKVLATYKEGKEVYAEH